MSDHSGSIAVPLETVPAHPRKAAVRRIKTIAAERDAIEIIVGLPKNMSGTEGKAAQASRLFAAELASRLPGVRICLVDERLSTTQAQSLLHEAGLNTRKSRNVIDQMAAQIILEQGLELERVSGSLPGQQLEDCRLTAEGV